MVITRRFFLSFAAQDAPSRDLLHLAVREANLPYLFSEISIKVPEDSFWQKHCRAKIMQCDVLIVLVSENTTHARGVLWEVACARKAAVPVHGIRVAGRNRKFEIPPELEGIPLHDWREDGLGEFLSAL